jgi:hypothetical protein
MATHPLGRLLSPAKAKSLRDMSSRCQPCGSQREIAADDATVALPLLDAIGKAGDFAGSAS